jgi:hypothetical protein
MVELAELDPAGLVLFRLESSPGYNQEAAVCAQPLSEVGSVAAVAVEHPLEKR